MLLRELARALREQELNIDKGQYFDDRFVIGIEDKFGANVYPKMIIVIHKEIFNVRPYVSSRHDCFLLLFLP